MSKTVFMGNSIILHNVKKFKNWTKTLLLKTCSDLLFCGSIFIDVTSQRFLHICYMGYLTLIRYFFMGGMTTSRYLKIWSDLANLKYLGNKELLNKFHICAKWVTKTHIWAHLTAPQALRPELAGVAENPLATKNFHSQTFCATWVRDTCQ